MFHRSLFQLVVFTGMNPKLTEIAEFLNGPNEGSQGFLSDSMSCGCGWEDMHLRDSFSGQVELRTLFGILAPRPSERSIDDVDYFVDKRLAGEHTCHPVLNKSIRVEFGGQGHVLVADHGQFR
jgi:hypothetical protein